MGEYKQPQYGKNTDKAEEAVEFKSQNPDIPQDVEFKADQELEEQIDETSESNR